ASNRRIEPERFDKHRHALRRPSARNGKPHSRITQAMYGVAGAVRQNLLMSDERAINVGEQERDFVSWRHPLRSTGGLAQPIGSHARPSRAINRSASSGPALPLA